MTAATSAPLLRQHYLRHRYHNLLRSMSTNCGIRVEVHSRQNESLAVAKKLLSENVCEMRFAESGTTNSIFSPKVFFDELGGSLIGHCLILAKTVTSTQQLLSAYSSDLPIGTVFVADTQSLGKGRGNNHWDSQEGCLMFSFTCDFYDGASLPCVQYIASIAMIEAIGWHISNLNSRYISLPFSIPDLRIKWPNDIYYGTKKIGGILCNSVYKDGIYLTTIGVGLNVSNKEPSICLTQVIGCFNAQSLSHESLLAKFLECFSLLKEEFCDFGFSSIKEKYTNNWLHSDQTVVIKEEHGGILTEVPLTVKGLTDSGFLLAEDQTGQKFELCPDGNSFDFFNGLIRRKVL